MSEDQTELKLEAKPENHVSDQELNALREQIKQKDSELAQERKEKHELGSKLGTEVNQRFSAQESAIENAIIAASAEIDGLEKQQTTLMEEGKFGEASKISRLIASAQFRLDGAKSHKGQIETYKSQAAQQIEQAKNDPLAQYSDSAKSWIRKNPAFLSDKKFNARVMAAHNMAVADDIQVDSSEYFERLDEAASPQTKVVVAPKEDDLQETVEDVKPKQNASFKASTAAPVSRGGQVNGSSGGGGKRIQLTADQAEAALISFPKLTPQDAYVKYAENMKSLKEAGKL